MKFSPVLCFVWNIRYDEHVRKPCDLRSMFVGLNCMAKDWTGNS